MANIKFSAFTTEANSANVDFLVGYQGTTMKKIAPGNLGGYPFLIDTDSLYSGFVPTGLSGNPQDNTILGIRAGDSLTSGDSNTLIGNQAGDSITTGTNSTAIGQNALSSLSTGGNNVAIGQRAYSSGTASNNVYIGNDAGASANTGIYQIGIGVSAGNSNTGSNSIGIGWFANRNNSASGTISIGHQAGYSNTSGVTNTYIGYQSGYNTTTGGDNTYVGYQTGYSASGSHNTAVGDGSFGGGFGHTGSDNASFGYLALQAPTGASNYNVAMGAEALRASGTKSNNVGIGYKAGTAMTTGSDNTLVGKNAGVALTTGLQNVVIGSEACEVGTGIINYNVTIGYRANENSGSGHNYDSVAIGQGAGQNTAAEGNVIIGYNAQEPSLTGGFNTIIGKQAKVGNTGSTGTNNLVLGYQAQSSASNVTNEITLGNSSITSLRCAVTSITSLSDERDKSEIKDLEYGLAFIDALQPREFVWDNRPETKLIKDIENGTETEVEFYSANKGKKDFGFIAQEVR